MAAENQEAKSEVVRKRYEDFVLTESQGFFERILGRAKAAFADQ